MGCATLPFQVVVYFAVAAVCDPGPASQRPATENQTVPLPISLVLSALPSSGYNAHHDREKLRRGRQMKCQRCPKQATLHITEVLGDDRFEEAHLCEECAKKYLYEPHSSKKTPSLKGGEGAIATDEPDVLGEKQCEACGLKFVEFRNNGRLGCPHDYDAFKADLLPLLESVHGETKHA